MIIQDSKIKITDAWIEGDRVFVGFYNNGVRFCKSKDITLMQFEKSQPAKGIKGWVSRLINRSITKEVKQEISTKISDRFSIPINFYDGGHLSEKEFNKEGKLVDKI